MKPLQKTRNLSLLKARSPSQISSPLKWQERSATTIGNNEAVGEDYQSVVSKRKKKFALMFNNPEFKGSMLSKRRSPT